MADYIKEIRALVGHKPILLNAAGGAVFNDQGQILIQQRTDNRTWSLPGKLCCGNIRKTAVWKLKSTI